MVKDAGRQEDGRSFRLFNAIDDLNREGLAIEADVSKPGERVARTLDRVIERRGKPAAIRCDGGLEYVGEILTTWAKRKGIWLKFMQQGDPQQNAYVELYNRTVRDDWPS